MEVIYKLSSATEAEGTTCRPLFDELEIDPHASLRLTIAVDEVQVRVTEGNEPCKKEGESNILGKQLN